MVFGQGCFLSKMQLEEFAQKNKLSLNPIVLKLCGRAMEMMKKSRDVLHDINHIQRMVDFLDGFINSNENQKFSSQIDFDVLLSSIAWHDTWKYRKHPIRWYLLNFNNWEEKGASRWFEKAARQLSLDSQYMSRIAHELRNHGDETVVRPHKGSLEGKLLWDLDTLDIASLERLEAGRKRYLEELKPTRFKLFLFELAKKRILDKLDENLLCFDWSKKKFVELWPKQRQSIEESVKEYKNLLRGN